VNYISSYKFDQIDFDKVTLDDFEFNAKPIGSGSFGQVYKTKFRLDGNTYAVKKLEKDFLVKVSLKLITIHRIKKINTCLGRKNC